MNLPKIENGMYEGFPVIFRAAIEDNWMIITVDKDDPEIPIWEIHTKNGNSTLTHDDRVIKIITELAESNPTTLDDYKVAKGAKVYSPEGLECVVFDQTDGEMYANYNNGEAAFHINNCTVAPKSDGKTNGD